MAKFIAYEKLSKKEQKKLNAEKRKTWGDVKPITKVKPSAKLYNRKKKQDLTSYSKLNPVFYLLEPFKFSTLYFYERASSKFHSSPWYTASASNARA